MYEVNFTFSSLDIRNGLVMISINPTVDIILYPWVVKLEVNRISFFETETFEGINHWIKPLGEHSGKFILSVYVNEHVKVDVNMSENM